LIERNKDMDVEKLRQWQNTRSPELFADLVIRYQPVVNSVVNRYSTVGIAPATLRAQATSQLIKAFKSFDPDKGAQPTTHIWNNLQKVQRLATESQISGHIPENRNLKRATFTIVKQNLEDRLGYEPNTSELSDELGWNKKETGRMLNEVHGETTASKAAFDFYGNSVTKEHSDKALADYLYHELDNKDKVIFEHTFGYGGKPVLNNKDIAKRLRVNEMFVHRSKKRLSKRISEMR
jgi:DNA-directed RNA polymerase specialized sigma subunit